MARKNSLRKIAGLAMVGFAIWIFIPLYFLPTESEFYIALFLYPFIGMWAFVVPFILAIIMLPVGLVLLGLPINGDGIRRAVGRMKRRR